ARKLAENLTLKDDNQELSKLLQQVKDLAQRRDQLVADGSRNLDTVNDNLKALQTERLEVLQEIDALQPRPVRAKPGDALDSPRDNDNAAGQVTPRMDKVKRLAE
ncbi:unnamed protein product, partial [Polarella glacialis]